MTISSMKAFLRRRRFGVHVVGAGIMGLFAALDLARLGRQMGLDIFIRIYETSRCGGSSRDVCTSAPRSQLWLHTDGQLYAPTQPGVCLTLQRSTRRLRELAPYAFSYPLALSVAPAASALLVSKCFESLGVPHWPVPQVALKEWLPAVRIHEDYTVYRVRDATIDLALLSFALVSRAEREGIELDLRGVSSLELSGDQICGLRLEGGERVAMGGQDQLVLACSGRIRSLLKTAGLAIPGLRVFHSALVATDTLSVPALIAVVRGGANCVPHVHPHPVNVFGNSRRREIAEEEPFREEPDPDFVESIRTEAREYFGLRIPRSCLAWRGTKTEIVPEGPRSQSHHAIRIPSVQNGWLAIPGKLSQAPACGEDLAKRVLRGVCLGETLGRPYWEEAPGWKEEPLRRVA